jgi:hypothetical protein
MQTRLEGETENSESDSDEKPRARVENPFQGEVISEKLNLIVCGSSNHWFDADKTPKVALVSKLDRTITQGEQGVVTPHADI